MRWLCWLALRGLWSRRWRSLLSLSALALSVGLVVATGSIGALMQASVVTPARLICGSPAPTTWTMTCRLVCRRRSRPCPV